MVDETQNELYRLVRNWNPTRKRVSKAAKLLAGYADLNGDAYEQTAKQQPYVRG